LAFFLCVKNVFQRQGAKENITPVVPGGAGFVGHHFEGKRKIHSKGRQGPQRSAKEDIYNCHGRA
jgi:hypothetical protein